MIAMRIIIVPHATPTPASRPVSDEAVEGDGVTVGEECGKDGEVTAVEDEDGLVSEVVVSPLVDVAMNPTVELSWGSCQFELLC